MLRKTSLSIMGSIVALRISSIQHNDTRHNEFNGDNQHNGFNSALSWV
jgi:hypothetical protein